jgi:hypothetical protein
MFRRLLRRVFNLSKLGIHKDVDDEVSRRIAFSNVVFISLPLVYLLFMAIDFNSFWQPISILRFDQFIVPIVILLCVFCLWLNKEGVTVFSRILFIVLWPALLHIIPIILLSTPPDYYIAFPFGLIFHSILIQLVFSHRKEPFIFWSFLTTNFIILFFAPEILAAFVETGVQPNEIVFNKYFLLDNILYWLLFNLVMFYILLVVEEYIRRVNLDKSLIENQKEELDVLNTELKQLVAERTLHVEEKDLKLKDYAFYNSHLLRAPFCRVQGLVQLLKMTKEGTEMNDEIMERLDESLVELHEVIKNIKNIVENEV